MTVGTILPAWLDHLEESYSYIRSSVALLLKAFIKIVEFVTNIM